MNKIPHKYQGLLNAAMGPAIRKMMVDETVIEIMLNPDGRLFIETNDGKKTATDTIIKTGEAENLIKVVASIQGIPVHRHQPEVAGDLPDFESRFQGFVPPVVTRPVFSIRKHQKTMPMLDTYVTENRMSIAQATYLRQAIIERKNILICGGTSTGKTTLAAALLQELQHTEERVFILEDIPELKVSIPDQVVLRTTPEVSMRALVRGCLRMRPDRIVVGELRDGAALELLKAWNTGHPGGITTLHANGVDSVVARLTNLILEVSAHLPIGLISEALDVIIELEKNNAERGRVSHIVQLSKHDKSDFIPAVAEVCSTKEIALRG
jgi:type IV secretion system protein TrbB